MKAVKDKYGGKYNINNIVMASTHTHSAPGGYSNYFFYNIATLGFVKQNFEAIMNGILKVKNSCLMNPIEWIIKIESVRFDFNNPLGRHKL